MTIKAALNAELYGLLGHEKHEELCGSNRHSGYSNKILTAGEGQFGIDIPIDSDRVFELQIIKNQQARLTEIDDKIYCLYAKVRST